MSDDSERILFEEVSILDGSGRPPVRGDVLVEHGRITAVGVLPADARSAPHTIVRGQGRMTLLPGLCDAHAHLSWLDSPTFDALNDLPLEEHLLATLRNAKLLLDSGFTMAVGAAAAKLRLDVVVRNAIESGAAPGPRYLANGPEIGATGGYTNGNPSHVPVPSYTILADGVERMRAAARAVLHEGVDLLKLGVSGEALTPHHPVNHTLYDEDEIRVAVTEAGKRGARVCVHARSAESVKVSVRAGAQIVYHASWLDDEALDLLEARRDSVFVVPSLAFPLALCAGEGEPFGVSRQAGLALYGAEVEAAIDSMTRLRRRGVRILPGGDYGFAFTPHGTNARDLEHFVNRLGYAPGEAIAAATALGGEIMGRGHELGRVAPGYLADLLLVDGDPSVDVRVLQDRRRLAAIVKGGVFHKAPASCMAREA